MVTKNPTKPAPLETPDHELAGPAVGPILASRRLARQRETKVAAYRALPLESPCGRSRGERFEAAHGIPERRVLAWGRWLDGLTESQKRLYLGDDPPRWSDLPARARRLAERRAVVVAAYFAAEDAATVSPARSRVEAQAKAAARAGVSGSTFERWVAQFDAYGVAGLLDVHCLALHRQPDESDPEAVAGGEG